MSLLGAIGSVVGGLIGSNDADKQRKQDLYLAKNSVKLRVEDAKRSGIHPLYALGAPTITSSSVTSPMGQAVANAGEQLGQAISSDYEKQLQAKNLENIQADIDLKKSQSLSYIVEAKNASNLSRANQTGRTAGNPNALTIAGSKISPSGDWSNAQDVEDRYGDLISAFYGFFPMGADTRKKFNEYLNSSEFKKKYGKIGYSRSGGGSW